MLFTLLTCRLALTQSHVTFGHVIFKSLFTPYGNAVIVFLRIISAFLFMVYQCNPSLRKLLKQVKVARYLPEGNKIVR